MPPEGDGSLIALGKSGKQDSLSITVAPICAEIGATEIVFGQPNDESRKSTSRNGSVIDGIIRLHPLEDWTDAQVMAYLFTKMEIPAHYSIKHSSLDCYDCTAYRKDSHDRVEFTRARHPEMYEAYSRRVHLLNQALLESI